MEDSDCTTPNRTWRNRVLAVLVVFGVALGMTLASATTANAAPLKAAPITYGAVTNNCGIVTCSIYISRSGTKSMNRFVSSKVGQYGTLGSWDRRMRRPGIRSLRRTWPRRVLRVPVCAVHPGSRRSRQQEQMLQSHLYQAGPWRYNGDPHFDQQRNLCKN